MTSISFPHAGDADAPGFYPNAFDSAGAGGASFQMNPLSAHPPRTPRASTAGADVYGVQVYAPAPEPLHELDVDEEDEKTRARAARVRREAVWREMLKTSVGRDKAFKVLQYGLKLYLLFHTSLAAARVVRAPRAGAWDHGVLQRLDTAIGRLSLSRKCLILFDWLAPLAAIRAQHVGTPKGKAQARPLLHAVMHAPPPVLLELVQAVADDVSTAGKLGLLTGAAGRRAGRAADWCLFASTLVNLVENAVERSLTLNLQHEVESRLYDESMAGPGGAGVYTRRTEEKELQRLRTKDYWMQVQRAKLLMDLVFVSFDVFNINRAKRPVQTFAGLASGILAFSRLYNTHKVKLLGATV